MRIYRSTDAYLSNFGLAWLFLNDKIRYDEKTENEKYL